MLGSTHWRNVGFGEAVKGVQGAKAVHILLQQCARQRAS